MTGGGAERTRDNGEIAEVIDGVDAGTMAVTARRRMGSSMAGLSIPFERAASMQSCINIMRVGGESVKLAVRRNCVFRGEFSRIQPKLREKMVEICGIEQEVHAGMSLAAQSSGTAAKIAGQAGVSRVRS